MVRGYVEDISEAWQKMGQDWLTGICNGANILLDMSWVIVHEEKGKDWVMWPLLLCDMYTHVQNVEWCSRQGCSFWKK